MKKELWEILEESASRKIWENHKWYIENPSEEDIKQVDIVKALWEKSNNLKGYCPREKSNTMGEYHHDDYEIGWVTEHSGVECVVLRRNKEI